MLYSTVSSQVGDDGVEDASHDIGVRDEYFILLGIAPLLLIFIQHINKECLYGECEVEDHQIVGIIIVICGIYEPLPIFLLNN